MKEIGTVLATALLLLTMATAARADAILEVTDGSGTTTYTDDDGDGLIQASAFGGGWTFLINLAASQPAVDGMMMHIGFSAAEAVEAVIYFSDDDFEHNGGSTTMVVSAKEAVSGSAENWWGLWADAGNTTLARTTTIYEAAGFDYSGARSVYLGDEPGLYSTTMGIGLDLSAGTFGSIDYVVSVPEPGTLGLLGLGLLGAGIVRRRRRSDA